jgi:hypothetical protein
MPKALTSSSARGARVAAISAAPPGRLTTFFTRVGYPTKSRFADVLNVVVTQARQTEHAVTKPCACGHSKTAHQHYRAGTDCSGCSCGRYAKRRRGIDLRIHL